MPARTGRQFLEGLKAPRAIYVGDAKVTDIASHPAFQGAAEELAAVFDLQHQKADRCLIPDPETGEPINASHLIPRSREDLAKRHASLEVCAERSVGLMGRTPDYMNVTFAGFAARSDEWSLAGNEAGAENLVRFQKELRRKDLSLTHTIIHPTVDKALGDAPRAGNDVALHKVGETEHGVIVRGSRILATLAPFADEMAVYPSYPLPEGADAFALAFSIPMTTPGMKILCRDSFSQPKHPYDHPLSGRFDEQDAFVIFDDVEVPRDRVFIDANLAAYNAVMRTSWSPNIMQQTMIRAQTKLEFAWGLANRMLKCINGKQPPAAEMLGEIWTYSEFARAAIYAAEMQAQEYPGGSWFPDVRPLHALRATLPFWFPRVGEIIRVLGSHNMFAAPTEAQMRDPELKPLVDRYLRGAGDVSAEERVRVFRLAWDFVGSALASRNEQYERFYLASGPRNRQMHEMFADPSRADRLVDQFLTDAPQGASQGGEPCPQAA
ncbi:MAG: 4-hydroxyphenylacetate 3-hydroxylase family protein [Caulobacterales bacterium]